VIQIKKIEKVYQFLKNMNEQQEGVSAAEIADELDSNRANISRYLNKLYRDERLVKIQGRPVLYKLKSGANHKNTKKTVNRDIDLKANYINQKSKLDEIIGAKGSLKNQIQQAKAAILYPPNGLHTLLLGETGVGKSMFANLMHGFAVDSEMIAKDAPFVQFNCADYSDNPQLLISQIFGVKNGAYTGANKDRDGLLKKADQGVLFLDEVHRLPPQGQEMLFTFIDNGHFRPLGESEKKMTAQVQIIAATTEEPGSFLLNTFVRRIPMVIKLPSLKNRGLKERFRLIENFLKEESKNIGKSIYIDRNSLVSFLLYDCPNNIGQLASDIQLAGAKSFLNYKTSDNKYILISQEDIPEHVQKGILNLHHKRSEVENLFKGQSEVLEFSYSEENKIVNLDSDTKNEVGTAKPGKLFYDVIEDKLNSLRQENMNEEKIQKILNIDIEAHFKKHLESLPNIINKSDINKIVENEIIEITEDILQLSSRKLQRKFDKKIFLALALHLQKSIERIKAGEKIYHPELNNIRINHFQEFMTAIEAASLIDKKFEIETPLDEIGYISMFLIKNPYQSKNKCKSKVAVYILMHGNSTATSMADVANKLLGENFAVGMDMPLDMDAEKFFEHCSTEINKNAKDRDILLLVDMGSLTGFAEMMEVKNNRKIKIIDMVSTPIVIDACRKAILGQSIEEINNNTLNYITQKRNKALAKNDIFTDVKAEVQAKKSKNLIITACFTGEGASSKLKEIIADKYSAANLEIISLNIIDYDNFINKIKEYQKNYNLLAVVSTVDIKKADIPFIPAVDILSGKAFNQFDTKMDNLDSYNKIKNSLGEHLEKLNSSKIVNECKNIIDSILNEAKLEIDNDVKIGILMHIIFLIEKLLQGEIGKTFAQLNDYLSTNQSFIDQVEKKMLFLEKEYAVKIPQDEIAFIAQSFLENSKNKNNVDEN